jgi:hypothetical protein
MTNACASAPAAPRPLRCSWRGRGLLLLQLQLLAAGRSPRILRRCHCPPIPAAASMVSNSTCSLSTLGSQNSHRPGTQNVTNLYNCQRPGCTQIKVRRATGHSRPQPPAQAAWMNAARRAPGTLGPGLLGPETLLGAALAAAPLLSSVRWQLGPEAWGLPDLLQTVTVVVSIRLGAAPCIYGKTTTWSRRRLL